MQAFFCAYTTEGNKEEIVVELVHGIGWQEIVIDDGIGDGVTKDKKDIVVDVGTEETLPTTQ